MFLKRRLFIVLRLCWTIIYRPYVLYLFADFLIPHGDSHLIKNFMAIHLIIPVGYSAHSFTCKHMSKNSPANHYLFYLDVNVIKNIFPFTILEKYLFTVELFIKLNFSTTDTFCRSRKMSVLILFGLRKVYLLFKPKGSKLSCTLEIRICITVKLKWSNQNCNLKSSNKLHFNHIWRYYDVIISLYLRQDSQMFFHI